jgi:hypothetical protein
MSLLSSTGPLDKLSSAMHFMFGVLYALTFGLRLSFVEPVMEMGFTFGGLMSTYEPHFPYTSSLFTVMGGSWAFGIFAANLSGVMGDESKEVREHRQMINFASWTGWALAFSKYTVLEGNQGGLMGGSFNWVWLAQFVIFSVLHLKWVMDGDLVKKMKIA